MLTVTNKAVVLALTLTVAVLAAALVGVAAGLLARLAGATATVSLQKAAIGFGYAFTLLLAALLGALWLRPPDLLRIGANYSAKIVCSNVFLAGRDPDEVLRTDVQAPGIALLRLMRISVDRQQHVIRAGLLGFIGDGLAVDRPNTGCAVVPDGNLDFAIHVNKIAAQTGAAAASAAPTPCPAKGSM